MADSTLFSGPSWGKCWRAQVTQRLVRLLADLGGGCPAKGGDKASDLQECLRGGVEGDRGWPGWPSCPSLPAAWPSPRGGSCRRRACLLTEGGLTLPCGPPAARSRGVSLQGSGGEGGRGPQGGRLGAGGRFGGEHEPSAGLVVPAVPVGPPVGRSRWWVWNPGEGSRLTSSGGPQVGKLPRPRVSVVRAPGRAPTGRPPAGTGAPCATWWCPC